jgi:hypothetical protein
MTGTNVKIPIKIRGLAESPITDISLTNINLQATEECLFQNCQRIRMNDVFVNGKEIKVP